MGFRSPSDGAGDPKQNIFEVALRPRMRISRPQRAPAGLNGTQSARPGPARPSPKTRPPAGHRWHQNSGESISGWGSVAPQKGCRDPGNSSCGSPFAPECAFSVHNAPPQAPRGRRVPEPASEQKRCPVASRPAPAGGLVASFLNRIDSGNVWAAIVRLLLSPFLWAFITVMATRVPTGGHQKWGGGGGGGHPPNAHCPL